MAMTPTEITGSQLQLWRASTSFLPVELLLIQTARYLQEPDLRSLALTARALRAAVQECLHTYITLPLLPRRDATRKLFRLVDTLQRRTDLATKVQELVIDVDIDQYGSGAGESVVEAALTRFKHVSENCQRKSAYFGLVEVWISALLLLFTQPKRLHIHRVPGTIWPFWTHMTKHERL